MSEYMIINGELYHHGIKGRKWGVRRYQNKDGSYTPAGRKRYSEGNVSEKKAAMKTAKKEYNKSFNKAYNKAVAAYSPIKKHREANDKRWEDAANKAEAYNAAKKDYKQAKKAEKQAKKELKKAQVQRGKELCEQWGNKELIQVGDMEWRRYTSDGRLEKMSDYDNKALAEYTNKQTFKAVGAIFATEMLLAAGATAVITLMD